MFGNRTLTKEVWRKETVSVYSAFLILLLCLGMCSPFSSVFAESSDSSFLPPESAFSYGLPEPGRYVRKNNKGGINGVIQVFVLPGKAEPVASFYASDFSGTQAEADKGISRQQILCLGGQICWVQHMTAARIVAESRIMQEKGKYREEELSVQRLPYYEVLVSQSYLQLKNGSGTPPSVQPDLSGIYQKEGDGRAFADKYAAVALVESLPFRDTQLEYWSGEYEIRLRDMVKNSGIVEEYPQLGNLGPGFEIRVLHRKTGNLHMTFVVSDELKAVYKITPDGHSHMIYGPYAMGRG